ncbi:RNA-binding protein [Thermococcus chitonophagus]|uniref:RNA-binding protein n=1 Tax=Thermococcus chitonophagus TaxID=54262 RepID=A0A161JXD0_9EURY|nr:THUMP domain-containing protein [Thermococcus chitonophagus]ASJ15786.1 RNA-binding protein [Thermococcus chitonophagus]CUX77014.1 tRNA acetyltransferase TAN1 [Thermococcus chitonophagus]
MKFIATCLPGREGDAMLELEWAINARVRRTKWGGVLLGETNLGRDEAIKRVREFETFALQSFIPIDDIVDLENLEEKVKGIKLPPGKSFAVRVKVRGAKVGEKSLEKRLGGIIKAVNGNPVNLEEPDVIIMVNVLGKKAGISVLRPEEIVKKEARD